MVKMGSLLTKSIKGVTHLAVQNYIVRKFLLKNAVKRIYREFILKESDKCPPKEQEDKFYMARALFYSIERAISHGISPKCRDALLDILFGNILRGGDAEAKEKFYMEFGFYPPTFVTISPTKACNLRCIGCYASSEERNAERLDLDVFDRIIQEIKELWGSHFVVISGGEPLLYKGLFDIAEKHRDTFFLMYTNGTLIDEKVAKKLAELGNITPAISVEGFEKETDTRRGKGVYKRIRKAMQNLRDSGVPFGISITATSQNVDIITSDEFYDFYFEKEPRAFYAWIFHYMPIGRGYTIELMPTPEQRLLMWERIRKIVRERKIFIADFWNDGVITDGCISAGRTGGYFYINWNGECTPCVFQPYAVHNINEVYKKGGNLNTVLNSEFFKAIRKWQDEYAYKQPKDRKGNLLRPCIIRDHYGIYYRLLKCYRPKPIDEAAMEILSDDEYREKLIAYGEKVEKLTRDIWEREYLQKTSKT